MTPPLELKAQLLPLRDYLFTRVDDEFAVEPAGLFGKKTKMEHSNIAKRFGNKGKTPEGKFIVSDGGTLTAYTDRIVLRGSTFSTKIEALIGLNINASNAAEQRDQKELPVRLDTGQKLANLLGIRVDVEYIYAVDGRKETITCNPQQDQVDV